MKIVCTTKEYAEMVRRCECRGCGYCVLEAVCGEKYLEDAVGVEIVKEEA